MQIIIFLLVSIPVFLLYIFDQMCKCIQLLIGHRKLLEEYVQIVHS